MERVIECPGDALVLVRPEGAADTLRWRTGKAEALRLTPGGHVRLAFDTEKIWLLR